MLSQTRFQLFSSLQGLFPFSFLDSGNPCGLESQAPCGAIWWCHHFLLPLCIILSCLPLWRWGQQCGSCSSTFSATLRYESHFLQDLPQSLKAAHATISYRCSKPFTMDLSKDLGPTMGPERYLASLSYSCSGSVPVGLLPVLIWCSLFSLKTEASLLTVFILGGLCSMGFIKGECNTYFNRKFLI